ncbi:MAG: hypothetical protein JWM59_1987, partial [Verrucomicrobiales bacterium]|nr:hypothetical protein [Verrucomicrobiales bacterium]
MAASALWLVDAAETPRIRVRAPQPSSRLRSDKAGKSTGRWSSGQQGAKMHRRLRQNSFSCGSAKAGRVTGHCAGRHSDFVICQGEGIGIPM